MYSRAVAGLGVLACLLHACSLVSAVKVTRNVVGADELSDPLADFEFSHQGSWSAKSQLSPVQVSGQSCAKCAQMCLISDGCVGFSTDNGDCETTGDAGCYMFSQEQIKSAKENDPSERAFSLKGAMPDSLDNFRFSHEGYWSKHSGGTVVGDCVACADSCLAEKGCVAFATNNGECEEGKDAGCYLYSSDDLKGSVKMHADHTRAYVLQVPPTTTTSTSTATTVTTTSTLTTTFTTTTSTSTTVTTTSTITTTVTTTTTISTTVTTTSTTTTSTATTTLTTTTTNTTTVTSTSTTTTTATNTSTTTTTTTSTTTTTTTVTTSSTQTETETTSTTATTVTTTSTQTETETTTNTSTTVTTTSTQTETETTTTTATTTVTTTSTQTQTETTTTTSTTDEQKTETSVAAGEEEKEEEKKEEAAATTTAAAPTTTIKDEQKTETSVAAGDEEKEEEKKEEAAATTTTAAPTTTITDEQKTETSVATGEQEKEEEKKEEAAATTTTPAPTTTIKDEQKTETSGATGEQEKEEEKKEEDEQKTETRGATGEQEKEEEKKEEVAATTTTAVPTTTTTEAMSLFSFSHEGTWKDHGEPVKVAAPVCSNCAQKCEDGLGCVAFSVTTQDCDSTEEQECYTFTIHQVASGEEHVANNSAYYVGEKVTTTSITTSSTTSTTTSDPMALFAFSHAGGWKDRSTGTKVDNCHICAESCTDTLGCIAFSTTSDNCSNMLETTCYLYNIHRVGSGEESAEGEQAYYLVGEHDEQLTTTVTTTSTSTTTATTSTVTEDPMHFYSFSHKGYWKERGPGASVSAPACRQCAVMCRDGENCVGFSVDTDDCEKAARCYLYDTHDIASGEERDLAHRAYGVASASHIVEEATDSNAVGLIALEGATDVNRAEEDHEDHEDDADDEDSGDREDANTSNGFLAPRSKDPMHYFAFSHKGFWKQHGESVQVSAPGCQNCAALCRKKKGCVAFSTNSGDCSDSKDTACNLYDIHAVGSGEQFASHTRAYSLA